MKIIKFSKDNTQSWGMLSGDTVSVIDGDIFGTYHVSDKRYDLSEVKVLPPCNPSKIVCVGLNYLDHQIEMNDFAEDFPKLFIKPSTAVIAHGEDIIKPGGVDRVDFEAELAVVIGKTAKNIVKGSWKDYVFGYTCLNDVTAREIQSLDVQWTRSKSYDTFAPCGPVIETELDPSGVDVTLLLNGEVKQHANTRQLIWDVGFLVEEISRIMTLLPGDIISTGTPAGCGRMEPGDRVEVVVEGIGTLTNYLTHP